MANSFGGTVKLAGESEYNAALKNITSNLKALTSNLKLADTEFKNNGSTVGDLKNKNDALKSKIDEEVKVVELCKKAIADFTKTQTSNKKAIDEVRTSYDNEKKKLDEMKNSTSATSSEISKQEKLVADLESKLNSSTSAYDKTNAKINDYQTKLNNAQISISNMTSELNKNESVLDKADKQNKKNSDSVAEFAKEEENAGNKAITFGDLVKSNLLSSAITSGLKSLVDSIKSVGSAFMDVGKQAVSSYADYEQLVGGVDTLFKDSSSKVQEYAANAYKTAGISSNEYMEQVTSFSASLLQSLGGDTAKAADIGDMAIQDMADNSNKMGTSMESIQNAYQGFAKQNYTMLD